MLWIYTKKGIWGWDIFKFSTSKTVIEKKSSREDLPIGLLNLVFMVTFLLTEMVKLDEKLLTINQNTITWLKLGFVPWIHTV